MLSADWYTKFSKSSMILMRLIILFSLVGTSALETSATSAQVGTAGIRQVRAIETRDIGLPNPAGLAFSPSANAFHIMDARDPGQTPPPFTDLITVAPFEDLAGSARIEAAIKNPINMAFDSLANRLLIFQPTSNKLVEVLEGPDGELDPATLVRHDARHFDIQNPQGMSVDPASGHIYILDGAGPRIVRIEPDLEGGFDGAVISEIDLSQTGLVDVRGLAFDPTNSHLHVLNSVEQVLYEITDTGLVVAIRDLSAFNLVDPQGMVFAPSADMTDDPAQMNLFITDSGLIAQQTQEVNSLESSQEVNSGRDAQQRPGNITEFSFTQTVNLEAASTATLIQIIDTSAFVPPSPDTAGIAYIDASNTLLFSDSEVNEMPIFTGDNLFKMTTTGNLITTTTTISFSYEPTGVAYNPANGHVFISDDDRKEIFEIEPGLDDLYGTVDDTITSFDTQVFNSGDPEGITYDTLHGALFIVDGVNSEVYKVTPGSNGVFDGVLPSSDDQITSFDTASWGIRDPEGITFSSDSGNLFIVGRPSSSLAEFTTSGTLVRMFDISAAGAIKPAGLAYAPGSLNIGEMNIYITDRGVDNNSHPDENDGKIYEMSLPPVTPGNEPPNVEAGDDKTITLPQVASLVGGVSDDGVPDPPGTVTVVWSQVSGPGTVTFANPNTLSTTASFSKHGDYVLRLRADDSELIGSDDLVITVEPPPNQAPTVNAGIDQAITLPNDAVLDGTVTDDDLPDPPATIVTTWSMVDGPGIVNFADANAVDTTASFSKEGVYVLRLTADDSDLNDSDEMTIIVKPVPNQAPTVNAGPDQTISLTNITMLDGTVTDDGLPVPLEDVTITWSKANGPGPVTFGNPTLVDTTASFSNEGDYTLRLTADDGDLSSFDEVTITVRSTMHLWLPIIVSR